MKTRLEWLVVVGALGMIAGASCGKNGGSGAGGGTTTDATSTGSSPDTSSTATGSGGGSTGPGGTTTGSSTGTGSMGGCLASTLLSDLGKTHVMVGASMADATAKSAPFDGRYLYISGGLFDGAGPCMSCAMGCTTNGTSCANNGPGCSWWGCWQYDQDPPGQYVKGFVGTAKGDAQIPLITYYEVLQASGVNEGGPEVTAMNDAKFLGRYLADFRFVLQKIGAEKAMVHIEPDFWGYVEQMNEDPHAISAPVQTANPTDCAAQENSLAGVGRCMIAMTRKYAPAARVGLHASAWGTKMDVLGNSDPNFDVAGEAQKLGKFLVAAGAGDGDFVVADMSDRDAGFYQSQGKNTWWDDTNQKLPTFHQAFAWAKAVAETVNKPIVWWQVPVGNMSLGNTKNHWKDNRVDYLFAHMDEVAAAHGAAVLFGAGEGQQTTPETDGNNLVAKIKAYSAKGGQAACP